jgi:Tol biopolymer transport system component
MFGRKRLHKPHTPRRQTAPSVRLSLERLEARETPSTLQPLSEPGPDSVVAWDKQWAAFSADGRYLAFGYDHSIFVRDRMTGATNRVDVAVDGGLPNGRSGSAAISATGRFIAFWSNASNLVANDTNNLPDVFVRDMQTGTTILASVAADGSQLAVWAPDHLSISADGQFVVFDGLVAERQGQVYLFDQGTGAAILIGLGYDSLISANGRFIAYANQSDDPVTGWSLYDRDLHSTRVIAPPWNSWAPGAIRISTLVLWISADGQQVAIQPYHSVVPGSGLMICNAPEPIVYIYDLQTGQSSPLPDVIQGGISASADGRYIAFVALAKGSATNSPGWAVSADGSSIIFVAPGESIPAGYIHQHDGVFILDRETGSYALVSEGLALDAFQPVISPDGQSVVFWNQLLDGSNLNMRLEYQIFLSSADDVLDYSSSSGILAQPEGSGIATGQPMASAGSPQADTSAPPSVFAPMLALTLPHSGGMANLIAWDLSGDGTADFIILTRRVHQRLNVTAFDLTAQKPLVHFGLTRPKQMPQFFNALVHLNRASLLGLLSAGTPRPVEPFGLFSTALLLASA